MQEMREPDDGLPLLGKKSLRGAIVNVDQIIPELFEISILRSRCRQMPGIYTEVLIIEVRPFVAPGIIDEGTVVAVNVFKRNPHSAHEAVWYRDEMNAVAMHMLLRADRKIQRLKGKCRAPE